MANINLTPANQARQISENSDPIARMKKAADTITQPRAARGGANYDGEVVVAKGATDARGGVGGVNAGVEGSGEVITTGKGYAEVEASHDITNGDASVSAKAGAMVGTKATGSVGGDVMGTGLDVTGEAWAGTGAEAEANATMNDWNLELEIKAGVGVDLGGNLDTTLGNLFGLDRPVTGGALGARVNIDGKPFVEDATEVVEDAIDNAESNAEALADAAADAAEAAQEAAEKAAEKAGEFVEDTSEAVSDFFSNLF